MNQDDYAYYRSRALQEDEAARGAACEAARNRHRRLADAYRIRCILFLAAMDTASSSIGAAMPSRSRPAVAG